MNSGKPLANQRHELFAQLLVKGKTADAAYIEAGYSPNRGNAVTLKANQNIQKRIAELMGPAIEEAEVCAAETIKHFAKAAYSTPEDVPTWGEKLNALDKLAKIDGLYAKDNAQKPAGSDRPIQIQVVMIGNAQR